MSMSSSSPLTELESGDQRENPFDLNADAPPAPSAPAETREFVMGPRQIASLAFVGVLIIGIMSAVAYFAGRKNTEQSKITERVIERVVTAPAPPAPVTAPAAIARPTTTPVESKSKAEVTAPAFNRIYLQAGSLDVGVAEIMVEGLRQRGLPAIVGIGINSKVARVLIGPFTSLEEQRVALKTIEDLGFRPFPRVFTEKDLEQQQITPMNTSRPPVTQAAKP